MKFRFARGPPLQQTYNDYWATSKLYGRRPGFPDLAVSPWLGAPMKGPDDRILDLAQRRWGRLLLHTRFVSLEGEAVS